MEKILVFQVEDMAVIRRIAGGLSIRLEEIDPKELRQPIEALVDKKKRPGVENYAGRIPQESLMLFCGLSDKHLDKILFELRRRDVKVDYKAILTETNRKWSVLQLYLELGREKAAMSIKK